MTANTLITYRHCWRSRHELISDVLLWTPHTWPSKGRTTYQVLPLRVRVDMEEMATKVYCTFAKSPKVESRHQMVQRHIQGTRLCVCVWGGSYTSADMQVMYSTASAAGLETSQRSFVSPQLNSFNTIK